MPSGSPALRDLRTCKEGTLIASSQAALSRAIRELQTSANVVSIDHVAYCVGKGHTSQLLAAGQHIERAMKAALLHLAAALLLLSAGEPTV